MVSDGEGQVHWILPTLNSSGLVDHEHLIINGTAPYVHHVGAVTGLRASYHTSNSFGLDWTPAGGLRMSYVLNNLSVAVSELNASGIVSTTLHPALTFANFNSHTSVGHATDTAGRSTVLVTEGSATGETLLYAPACAWTRPLMRRGRRWTQDNDGVCDASLGPCSTSPRRTSCGKRACFRPQSPCPSVDTR